MKINLIYLFVRVIIMMTFSIIYSQYSKSDLEENLKTCMYGRYPALCKEELLTSDYKKIMSKVNIERKAIGFLPNEKTDPNSGNIAIIMSSGDKMNLGTGDYIMDMGGGDKMNLGTGDYIMNMGGGDYLNIGTGDYIMDLGIEY